MKDAVAIGRKPLSSEASEADHGHQTAAPFHDLIEIGRPIKRGNSGRRPGFSGNRQGLAARLSAYRPAELTVSRPAKPMMPPPIAPVSPLRRLRRFPRMPRRQPRRACTAATSIDLGGVPLAKERENRLRPIFRDLRFHHSGGDNAGNQIFHLKPRRCVDRPPSCRR